MYLKYLERLKAITITDDIKKPLYYVELNVLQGGHNMDFRSRYRFVGLTSSKVAELFSVTERTIRNWEKKGAPPYVDKFLMLYEGRLDFFGKAWIGFRLTPECLESPEGDFVYPGEVRGLKYLYGAVGIDRTNLCTKLDVHGLLNVKLLPNQRPPSLLGLLPDNKKVT